MFSIQGNREVARWPLGATVVTAFAGAGPYFFENAGWFSVIEPLTGLEHKYSRLLVISAAVLGVGFTTFAATLRPVGTRATE